MDKSATSLVAVICAAVLLAPALARAEETARYEITVSLAWTQATHSADYPPNAHWSRLIAVAHRGRYRLFADGDTASSGMALLATNGRLGVLEAELAEARRRGRAGASVVVGGLSEGAGMFELTLDVSEEYSLVSLATMLAPSPDWFAGAASVPLRDEEGWRESVTVPLFVWDAGADSGASFDAPNADTQPRQSVRLATHPAFLQENGLRPIGSARFQRLPPETP